MENAIWFLVDVVVGGLAIILAARITQVQLQPIEAVIAVAVAAAVSLVPGYGWALSIVALFLILRHFSRAPIWPDLLLLVIVSRLLAFGATSALASS